MPEWMALVPAAGSGRRFRGEEPKIWAAVAGRPVLLWTVERLLEAGAVRIVVAVPEHDLERAVAHLGGRDTPVDVVAGGATRQESVHRALQGAEGSDDQLVAVHDGARPATAVDDILRTVEAATLSGAAVLGRPLTDTLKRVRGEAIVETLPRHDLFRAETPQVFRLELLRQAHERARNDGFEGTDDAALVERLRGTRIRVVAARAANPKLTRTSDLEELERLLTGRSADTRGSAAIGEEG